MEQSPSSEVKTSQLVKKFPVFYGNRSSITVFITARHFSLSWARSIQSTPSHHISIRPTLILFYHLRLGLQGALSLSDLTTKILQALLLSPHLIIPDLITRMLFDEEYISWISCLYDFLQSPILSSLWGPNIFISTPFSNSSFLCHSTEQNWVSYLLLIKKLSKWTSHLPTPTRFK
jgi:hypothetical protein